MTLTLELPSDVEQVLAARAQARGVSLPKYLQDLGRRDAQPTVWDEARRAQREAALSGHGKYASLGFSVDGLLSERREEAAREMEAAR